MIEMFEYEFVVRALVASIFCGICCGIIGSWIVLLNIPFIGVVISHSAFAGAVLGVFLGIEPMFVAIIFCLISIFLIGPISQKGNLVPNLSLSIVFSIFLSLAFIFMSFIKESKSEIFNMFWGNILTLSWEMVWSMVVMTIFIIVFIKFYHKKIFVVLFNKEIAESVGIRYKMLFYLILILAGIVVTLNLNTIGGLLIFSLIVTTPLSAYQLVSRVQDMYLLSSIFGIISCILGLVISYFLNIPLGATIILCSVFILFICSIISSKKQGKSYE